MKKTELKKYEVRCLEMDGFKEVCSRIDYLMQNCQCEINRYGHLGEYADEEELSDWEEEQVAEHQVRMQAYKTALAAIMKLMGM